jgi:ABC-type Fe3+/spermidine/putrescine transport system ATPase subunit
MRAQEHGFLDLPADLDIRTLAIAQPMHVLRPHDQSEALAVSDKIIVMNQGIIAQMGAPRELYEAPASRFIAGFIGEANLLKGRRKGGKIETTCGVTCQGEGADGPVALVVRPESIRRLASADQADMEITGAVEEVVFLGAHVRYVLALPGGEKLRVQDTAEHGRATIGEAMRVGWSKLTQRIIEEGAKP